MHDTYALSLAPSSISWLTHSNQPKVLHGFDDVCNLINERREILSIVNAEIRNGPFNLVIEEPVLFSERLDIESKVFIQDTQISLGDITISFADAQTWNPMPKWDGLRKNKDKIIKQLSECDLDTPSAIASGYATTTNLQSLISSLCSSIISQDLPTTRNTTSKLAGLGIGLTPAGDDFLMGAMYATWVVHPHGIAKKFTEQIANIAAPLTTSLSGAWLRSAAKGEAGELWHEFFDALIEDKNMYLPMSKILSVGETSGSDALMGFLGTIGYYNKVNKL